MPDARKDVLLYKRHTAACDKNLSHIESEKRRYHMKCGCPIWVTGTMPDGSPIPRQSTYCTDESSARAYMATEIEKHLPANYCPTDPRLDTCIKRYVATKAQPEFASTTYRQNRDYLALLQQFCQQKNIVYMRQLNVDVIEDFKRAGLKNAYMDSTIGEIIKKVRAFLRESYSRSWIAEPLGNKVKRHYVEESEQAAPFEDEQLPLILNCRMKGYHTGYARYPETFRLLIELMLETGLRISDACLYNPAQTKREGDDEWEYDYLPRKTRKKKIGLLVARHQVYLSNRLKVAIDSCRWHSKDLPFIYNGRPFEKLAQAAYNRMQSIGNRAGVSDCRPHRCRDTFAVRLLTQGTQLDDVSRLLGHRSVLVTQAHYNRWIPKRASRLAGIARAAHVGFDLPPNVIGNPQDGVLP